MKPTNKKILAIVTITFLGVAVITAIYFQFFHDADSLYPTTEEIYSSEAGYVKSSELTDMIIYLRENNEIIFHYKVSGEMTLADTGTFTYNEKTGFLSTKNWKKEYPFKQRKIRIMNDPDPTIFIGKSRYLKMDD